MNNYNSKEKFQEFNNNSHYLRVDAKHPLELLIGLNDSGQKTIRLIGNYKKTRIKGTKSIEVNHYLLENHLVLSFSLCDENYLDLFYLFCNDLIDSSRNSSLEDGYVYLTNRFEKWRGFSNSTRKFLNEKEIKGLIGELLFIRDNLADKYGLTQAISAWTGPEPTKKDFYFENEWYEIKTASNGIVTISSLEQLESNQDGYLIVYSLEKASPESIDINLNSLVSELLNNCQLIQVRADFLGKLIYLGYDASDYYDSFVYQVRTKDIYIVDTTFPRLTRENLPKEISNVKYELIVNMIESYKRDLL